VSSGDVVLTLHTAVQQVARDARAAARFAEAAEQFDADITVTGGSETVSGTSKLA
jgi:phosphotransferase system HPr-like phosphotransfer protein